MTRLASSSTVPMEIDTTATWTSIASVAISDLHEDVPFIVLPTDGTVAVIDATQAAAVVIFDLWRHQAILVRTFIPANKAECAYYQA